MCFLRSNFSFPFETSITHVGLFYTGILHFTALFRYCVPYCIMKVYVNPALNKSIGTISPTAFLLTLCANVTF